jgi:phosphotransferase system IIB component
MPDYFVYIIIGCATTLAIGLFIFLIVFFRMKNVKKTSITTSDYDKYIDAFGGKENIISASSQGSRLILVLKDYDVVDLEELNKLGITSSIKMSNKITFIIGSLSSDIAKYINK